MSSSTAVFTVISVLIMVPYMLSRVIDEDSYYFGDGAYCNCSLYLYLKATDCNGTEPDIVTFHILNTAMCDELDIIPHDPMSIGLSSCDDDEFVVVYYEGRNCTKNHEIYARTYDIGGGCNEESDFPFVQSSQVIIH